MIAAIAKLIGIPGWAVIAGMVALALVGGGIGKCTYDSRVISKHEQKTERRARPATDKAANERASDTIRNSKSEQERHDVIDAQPDQPISPTSRALACKRLRDAGKHSPACS